MLIVVQLLLVILLVPGILHGEVLNTQQSNCYDELKQIACPSQGQPYYGQDGNYSRPPRSFSKLDSSGVELATDALIWSMVRDNQTSLVWEVKGSNNAADSVYPRCDSNPDTNSGQPGNCHLANNSEDYISGLNSMSYGGRTDWRLPTVQELLTLVHWGNYYPATDPYYFPRARGGEYLTSNYDMNPTYPGPVSINFKSGEMTNISAVEGEFRIRAVSGTSSSASYTIESDQFTSVVVDNETSLMWMTEAVDDPANFLGYLSTNWYGALDVCENSHYRSFSDWRLPSINELLSLLSNPYSNQVLPPEFSSLSNSLQSSTTVASELSKAWYFDPTNGEVIKDSIFGHSKLEPTPFSGAVLCVRDGALVRPKVNYSITIATEGSGSVALLNLQSEQLIVCDEACNVTFQEGAVFSLTAIADTDSTFVAWTDDCSSENNICLLPLDGDKVVSARFGQYGDLNDNGHRGLEEAIMILREQTEQP